MAGSSPIDSLTHSLTQSLDEASLFSGLERFGIDPAFEEVIPFADRSIVHTPHGRFRVERIPDRKGRAESPTLGSSFSPPLTETWSSTTLENNASPMQSPSRYGPDLPGLAPSQQHWPKKGWGRGIGGDARGAYDEADYDRDSRPLLSLRCTSSEPSPKHSCSSWSSPSREPASRLPEPVPSPNPYRYPAQDRAHPTLAAAPLWASRLAPDPAQALPSYVSPTASAVPVAQAYTGRPDLLDTTTPIVIPSDPFGPADKSVGRFEYVQPGEEAVFESSVGAASLIRSPFFPGRLKVFRNTLTNDLRFSTVVDCAGTREVHNVVVRPKDVELVPLYAYDFRQTDCVYLQNTEPAAPQSMEGPASASGPLGFVYNFGSTNDLLDFQSNILEESVCFDISNVRSVAFGITGSRTQEVHSPRVQLWHQRRQKRRPSDDRSFVASGTKLTTPDPDRTELLYSRLVVYLGRSQKFLTFFLTDDVSYNENGETGLSFSPLKYDRMFIWRSRPNLRCKLVERPDGIAGIRLDRSGLRPGDEDSFHSFKKFEISFEQKRDRASFLETWNQMIQARRTARERIQHVQLEMARNMYNGAVAMRIIG
ncbi:MAG: hypothetical protein M1815_001598 [Lichina confinis]|nr:MAG: hypothetical protein M1815_001598 [Lichina confinis]